MSRRHTWRSASFYLVKNDLTNAEEEYKRAAEVSSETLHAIQLRIVDFGYAARERRPRPIDAKDALVARKAPDSRPPRASRIAAFAAADGDLDITRAEEALNRLLEVNPRSYDGATENANLFCICPYRLTLGIRADAETRLSGSHHGYPAVHVHQPASRQCSRFATWANWPNGSTRELGRFCSWPSRSFKPCSSSKPNSPQNTLRLSDLLRAFSEMRRERAGNAAKPQSSRKAT